MGGLICALLSFISVWIIIPSCTSELNQALDERYTLMAEYLGDSFSQGLQTGMGLKDVHAPPHLLHTLKNQDDGVDNISIFSHNDQTSLNLRCASILHSTEISLKNTPLPVHWLPHIFDDQPHYIHDYDTSSVCVNIFTPYGQPVGGVILNWNHASFHHTLHQYYMIVCGCIALLTTLAVTLSYILFAHIWHPWSSTLNHVTHTYDSALKTKNFRPFIPSHAFEKAFYPMYRKTKSLFDMLSMIESNIHPALLQEFHPTQPSNENESHDEFTRTVS